MGLKVFSLFLILSHPDLAGNNAEKRLFNFLNFLNFFRNFLQNFLPQIECERNLRLKVFSLFFSLSHPVLAKTNAGKSFFNFFALVFGILFGIFIPRSGMNGIWHRNFFLSFSSYQIPIWLEIMPKRGFSIF